MDFVKNLGEDMRFSSMDKKNIIWFICWGLGALLIFADIVNADLPLKITTFWSMLYNGLLLLIAYKKV